MKEIKKEKESNAFLKILIFSCIIYTPISVTINLLCSLITNGQLLSLWANFLFFAISFIISFILHIKKKSKEINVIFNYAACSYTILSFIINSLVFAIKDGHMWSYKTIFLLIAYSIIVACIMKFVKIKSYLIATLIYYAISLASFMILTVTIAKYKESNTVMLLFGGFTVVYIVLSLAYYFVKRSFYKYENEEKEYKPQFD